MNIDFDLIKKCTCGVEYFSVKSGALCFHRYLKEEENAYKNHEKYKRVFTSSGVVISFLTDSKMLKIDYDVFDAGQTRSFYSIDIEKNGRLIDSAKNVKGEKPFFNEKEQKYADYVVAGDIKQFDLGKGEKKIRIYFPFALETRINSIELDDNAKIIPIKRDKNIIFYGDSITQGYDALHPTNHYTKKIANYLNADFINKGFGGDTFREQVVFKSKTNPDYVFVAFGTNDFSKTKTKKEFVDCCKAYYKKISEFYADATVFALTPIWRKDYLKKTAFKFECVKEEIIKATEKLKNVVVIDGFDFVPHNPKLYGDLRLHPNDKGFIKYAKSLIKQLKKHGF
ncbi:MAG: SGNH/GDSL hydrolase family protein [Clostridia bacterium]|nr:SGNH/GDSL hydrolase family protein [Clostridia bacterium]